jgi:hypothetical protein
MTINLDTEIVETRHDPVSRMNSYVLERGGRRWTVHIHLNDLDRHGANKLARRNHLGNLLQQAMLGKADGE